MIRLRAPDAGNPIRSILILALAPAVGLGIARFAYALVLPDMRASLEWSYAQAGFMNTANAAGYLLGALLTLRTAHRFRPESAVLLGTFACVVGLALSGATTSFSLLTIARLLAGVGAALAFIAGGALASALSQSQPGREGFLLGLFYAGPGVGIVLSGAITPFMLERLGPGSWAAAWIALAAISTALFLLLPFAGATFGPRVEGGDRKGLPILAMAPVLIGYGMFGAGYIAYMTFMIAWVQDVGGGARVQGLFWAAIGLATMASPWLWSPVIGALTGGRAVAALTAVTLLGALLPLVGEGAVALLGSALLFGSAFFAVVAAATDFVRRNLPRPAWAAGIATVTVGFGVGQTAGPILTGAVTDLTGILSAGLWTSVGLLAAGVIASLLQRDLAADLR